MLQTCSAPWEITQTQVNCFKSVIGFDQLNFVFYKCRSLDRKSKLNVVFFDLASCLRTVWGGVWSKREDGKWFLQIKLSLEFFTLKPHSCFIYFMEKKALKWRFLEGLILNFCHRSFLLAARGGGSRGGMRSSHAADMLEAPRPCMRRSWLHSGWTAHQSKRYTPLPPRTHAHRGPPPPSPSVKSRGRWTSIVSKVDNKPLKLGG